MKSLSLSGVIGKGRRGVVYAARFRGKDVAVKQKNTGVSALGFIRNEGKWLTLLNKKGIGPTCYFFDDKQVIMEHISGVHLKDFLLEEKDRKKIMKVMKNIMLQCRTMDKLKVNKYEMHRVETNALVSKYNKPVLIDFERCKIVPEAKNVTQFCEFLLRRHLITRKKKILTLLQHYKKDQSEKNFKLLLEELF